MDNWRNESMKTTIMIILAVSLSSTQVASSSDAVPSVDKIFNLPRGLLAAICQVESSGNPRAVHYHDGNGDSLGLCQIKLSTARLVGFKGTRRQLMNVRTNKYYAGKYLKYQISRYNNNYAKAVTAYNRGSCVSHGGTEYLARVFTAWGQLR